MDERCAQPDCCVPGLLEQRRRQTVPAKSVRRAYTRFVAEQGRAGRAGRLPRVAVQRHVVALRVPIGAGEGRDRDQGHVAPI